jgi:hypothetical protein
VDKLKANIESQKEAAEKSTQAYEEKLKAATAKVVQVTETSSKLAAEKDRYLCSSNHTDSCARVRTGLELNVPQAQH